MLLRPVRLSSYALRQNATSAPRTRRTGLLLTTCSAAWATRGLCPVSRRLGDGSARRRARGGLGDGRRRWCGLGGSALGDQDLGHAEAELLVEHHDLASRDRLAVDQQVHGLAGELVERDDRAGAQGQR